MQQREPHRLVALRLETIDTLVVKEPHTPVTFRLNIVEPLATAQLNLLATTSPWKALTVGTEIHGWNSRLQCFDATISIIEGHPRLPAPPKHTRRLRWGQVKRKRGFVSHD